MAELWLQDQLQPALLDRLADDEPEKKTESRDQRVISIAKLRNSVLRDLTWLLNSVHLAATEDLSQCPDVERSVLNYGLPSFAGGSTATLGILDTENAIRDTILRFEPRLIPNSVKVKLIAPIAMEEGLRFAIREGGRTVGAGVVSKVIE